MKKLPPIDEIQRDPEQRDKFIDYSAFDAKATFKLFEVLRDQLQVGYTSRCCDTQAKALLLCWYFAANSKSHVGMGLPSFAMSIPLTLGITAACSSTPLMSLRLSVYVLYQIMCSLHPENPEISVAEPDIVHVHHVTVLFHSRDSHGWKDAQRRQPSSGGDLQSTRIITYAFQQP